MLTSGKCSTSKCVWPSNHWFGGRMSPPGAAPRLLWKASLNWDDVHTWMQVCCLSLKSVFGWSINPKFYRYSGGSLVPCVRCTQKYLQNVVTERAKSVKRKISAIVIKELLKSKKPSLIGMRDVVPQGRKSECRSMAVKGSHQLCLTWVCAVPHICQWSGRRCVVRWENPQLVLSCQSEDVEGWLWRAAEGLCDADCMGK